MNAQTGYRVVGREQALNSRELAAALSKDGQLLAPMLELITAGKAVVDEAIDVIARHRTRSARSGHGLRVG